MLLVNPAALRRNGMNTALDGDDWFWRRIGRILGRRIISLRARKSSVHHALEHWYQGIRSGILNLGEALLPSVRGK